MIKLRPMSDLASFNSDIQAKSHPLRGGAGRMVDEIPQLEFFYVTIFRKDFTFSRKLLTPSTRSWDVALQGACNVLIFSHNKKLSRNGAN